MMKLGGLVVILAGAGVGIAAILPVSQALAFDFDTIVFADDFEGFANGHTLSGAGDEAPSTGVGVLWQYLGTSGAQDKVTTAQSYGPGTKSLEQVRPSSSTTPWYWTYPNVVPEANVNANTEFGIQYDLYLPQNELTVGQGPPFEGLSGINNGPVPGGSFTWVAGSLLSYGDGEVRVWDSSIGGYSPTGYFFGEGWQTLETSFATGVDLGGTANATVTVYLTRDDENSASALTRTQIFQNTETVPLGANWRNGFYNSGPGKFFLDNVILGTVTIVPEPSSLWLACCLAVGLVSLHRRRK